MHTSTVNALKTDETARALCGKHGAPPRHLAIQTNLGWLAPVLSETWTQRVKTAPELELLGQAVVQHQTPAAFGFSVTPTDALAWLAALSPPDDYCSATGDSARAFAASQWALKLLMWSTSEQSVYATAFAAFGQPWTRPTPGDTSIPWTRQSGAIQAVTANLGKFGRIYRVRAAGSPDGAMHFSMSYGFDDLNTDGTAPTLLSAEALLDAVPMALQAKDATRWLISESVIPLRIPDCMVFMGAEQVLPEVKPGKTAHFTLSGLGVSDRCGALETVQFEVISSAYAGKPTVTMWFEPLDSAATLDGYKVDTDVPGHSNGTSKAFEMTLRGTLRGATVDPKVQITSLSDRWSLGGATELPLSLSAQGDVSTLDDLDVTLLSESAASDSAAKALNSLTANDSLFWLQGVMSGTHPMVTQGIDAAKRCGKASLETKQSCEDRCSFAHAKCREPFGKDDILLQSHAAQRCLETARDCAQECLSPTTTPTPGCRPAPDLSDRFKFTRYLPVRL